MEHSRSSSGQHKIAYLIINAQIYPITKSATKIGRQLDNDLVIQDVLVSRYHAEIIFRQNSYFIRDLNSTAGTYLNNSRIEESLLFSNDLILIANTPIMFILEETKKSQDNFSRVTGSLILDEESEDNTDPNSEN